MARKNDGEVWALATTMAPTQDRKTQTKADKNASGERNLVAVA
ncbi:hypothetical protein [Rhodopirellula halodulae]|nr:hypothetical protein [Rhodopirellula sp. JC740]